MNSKVGKLLAVIILFIIGLCVFLYPIISDWQNNQMHVAQVDLYEREARELGQDGMEQEWQRAVDYNNSLAGNPVKDPFIPGSGRSLPQDYLSVLNINGTMGYVEIPGINIKLPLYHGTSDEVLNKGIGHIEGTALPIGSSGGHSVLTGHTGLPSAKLFTDLVEMEQGDKFYLHVLGKELVYQVDQISVINPEDVSQLVAHQGKDYVTLITCTPYGINSHRLLVRGERVYQLTKTLFLNQQSLVKYIIALVLALLLLLILLVVLLRKIIKRFHKPKDKQAQRNKKANPKTKNRRQIPAVAARHNRAPAREGA